MVRGKSLGRLDCRGQVCNVLSKEKGLVLWLPWDTWALVG